MTRKVGRLVDDKLLGGRSGRVGDIRNLRVDEVRENAAFAPRCARAVSLENTEVTRPTWVVAEPQGCAQAETRIVEAIARLGPTDTTAEVICTSEGCSWNRTFLSPQLSPVAIPLSTTVTRAGDGEPRVRCHQEPCETPIFGVGA